MRLPDASEARERRYRKERAEATLLFVEGTVEAVRHLRSALNTGGNTIVSGVPIRPNLRPGAWVDGKLYVSGPVKRIHAVTEAARRRHGDDLIVEVVNTAGV